MELLILLVVDHPGLTMVLTAGWIIFIATRLVATGDTGAIWLAVVTSIVALFMAMGAVAVADKSKGWVLLGLWACLLGAFVILRAAIWRATRDPYEREANQRALNGPLRGGGNADSEMRLNATGIYVDYSDRASPNGVWRATNRLNGMAKEREKQPGQGWRGALSDLVFGPPTN